MAGNRWMVNIGLALGSVALLATAALAALVLDSRPILFESAESSASPHGAIYNRITWSASWPRDVWVMQQSQKGWSTDPNSWDRLFIIVDKTSRPYRATFVQSDSGPLVTEGQIPSREYGVPCMRCHSNGPRAIRPVNAAATRAPVSLWDRLRLRLWNLRIVSYGRTLSQNSPLSSGRPRRMPLSARLLGAGANATAPLEAPTCRICHHDNGVWGRGTLSREQASSIRYLVARGLMPPPGFALSAAEKKNILDFVEPW